jgi:hypothetical protein
MIVRNLDFLCIGATKAGTTSFFYYIKDHPQIYVPPIKEIFFFDDEVQIMKGWNNFYGEHFYKAGDSQKTGKMSPRYLRDPDVPARVFENNPNIKLFILLRNPIERAFSHYKMLNRLGREDRTFSKLINDQLEKSNLELCRTSAQTGQFSLLTQGEYGRILEGYLKYFNREQILILFSETLDKDPVSCLNSFYDFIGVERILPMNIGRKYHVGGDKARFVWLYPFLKKLYFPKLLWHKLSAEKRKQLILWNNIKLKVSSKQKIQLNPDDHERLRNHYSDDVKLLENLFNVKVSWKDFDMVKD